MDLPALLKQLPPGMNLFDFLAETVNNQVYPDLGPSFVAQVYAVPTLCSLTIAIIIAGLVVRWYKGRLRFFVADGPATRLNPAVFVPLLWLISGICMIVHTFLLRAGLRDNHFTYSLGMLWWFAACGITASYPVISASVLCNAPVVRRWLMRLDAGHRSSKFSPAFIVLNSATVGIAILELGLLYIPANMQGRAFQTVHYGYTGLQALIAEAKASNNVSILATAGVWLDILAKAQDDVRRTSVVGGAMYTTQVVGAFLIGLIPSLFLNVYMLKRIDRLDKGLDASTQQFTSSLTGPSIVPVPLTFKGMHFSADEDYETLADGVSQPARPHVELPKDRPFTNLASNSALPQAYSTILQSQANPQEKAKRLKAALRRDNTQLLAYFLMLSAMGSVALFMAAKGTYPLVMKDRCLLSYTWVVWSYLAPALFLAVAFFWHAMENLGAAEDTDLPAVATFSGRNFQAPPLATIQLSQTVQVVEEYGLEEKKTMYENCRS